MAQTVSRHLLATKDLFKARQSLWDFVLDNLELELIFLQVFHSSFISVIPPKLDILSFIQSFIPRQGKLNHLS